MATVFETIGHKEEVYHDGEDLLGLLQTLEYASDEATQKELHIEKEESSVRISESKQLQLFHRTKEGDESAAEELINSVTDFVYFINRKTGSQFTEEEAIEIGYFGIAKAFDTFDVDRKVLFSTHACNHIRWAILNEIKRKKRITEHEKSSETIAEWHSGGPDPSRIVEHTLDSEEKMLKQRKLLGFLDQTAARIILYRSGAMDGTKYTQQETAEKMGISKQRVGQLEQVATDAIHTAIQNNGVLPISAVVNKIERDDKKYAMILREMHGINKHRKTRTVKEMMERHEMSQSGITTIRANARARLLLASGIISPEHDLQKAINMLKHKDKGKRSKEQTIDSLGAGVREKIMAAINTNTNSMHRDVLTARFGQSAMNRIATQDEAAESIGCSEGSVQMAEMLAIPEFCTHYLLQDDETTETQKGYVALMGILNTTKDSTIRKALLRILDSDNIGRIGEAIDLLPPAKKNTLFSAIHTEAERPTVPLERSAKRKIQYEQKIELLDTLEMMSDAMGIPLYENPTIQKISELNMTNASIEAIAEDDEVEEIKTIIDLIQKNQKVYADFLYMRLGIGREKKATYKEIQAETNLPLQTVSTMLGDALHLLDKKLSFARKQKKNTTPPPEESHSN